MSKTKTTPRRYQRTGIKLLHKARGRAILGDEVGLGKTPQSLWYAEQYIPKGTIIVVCPASLKEHWQREVKKHTNQRASVLYHTEPPQNGLFQPKGRIFIINDEILGLPKPEDSDHKKTWNDILQEMKPALVIIDEGHRYKNPRAYRTVAVKALTRAAAKRIMLTGTLILNRPEEAWSLFNIVRPELFPSRMLFCLRYCDPKAHPYGGYDFRGASNLEELYQICKDSGALIRRRKKDVLKDLPKMVDQIIPLRLDDKARIEYERVETDVVSWLAQTNRFLGDQYRLLKQTSKVRYYTRRKIKRAIRAAKQEKLAKLGYTKEMAARLKKKMLIEWIDNFLESTGGKLLVFGIHYRVLIPLYERFKGMAVLVNGATPERQRQPLFDKFNTDPKCRLFFGNQEAAGVGWSCTATSSMLFTEFPWAPGTLNQCKGRIHGIERGLKGVNATYYYAVALGTVEEAIIRLLDRKQKILERVMDGGKSSDFNLLNRFEETLLQRAERKAVHAALNAKRRRPVA